MKRIVTALFLVAICTFSTAALAGTRNHKGAHVNFWIPDDWKVEEAKDQITAVAPKEEVALLFLLKDAKDMKAALAALDQEIGKLATDVKQGEAQKVDINGMEGVVVDATGKAEGKKIDLSVMVIKTPANKYLMIFGMIESSKKKAHEAELTKILQSLKPAK